MPEISIIIPTWNRARFLKDCLASVFAQTYENYEAIVADDHSSDGTKAVVKSFRSPRLRFIRLDSRKGPAKARSVAIKASSGPIIAFLDSDDVWHPKKLESQLSHFRGKDVHLSYSDFDAIDEKGRLLMSKCLARVEAGRLEPPRRLPTAKRDRARVLLQYMDYTRSARMLPPLATSGLMLRRSVLDRVGSVDERFQRLHDDTDLCLRIAKRYPPSAWNFCREALCRYRLHVEQITRDFSKPRAQGSGTGEPSWTAPRLACLADYVYFMSKFLSHHYCRSTGHVCRDIPLVFRREIPEGPFPGVTPRLRRLLRSGARR